MFTEMKLTDIRMVKEIGIGSFSRVFEGLHRNRRESIALKLFKSPKSMEKEKLAYMSIPEHPSILSVLGSGPDFLVLEKGSSDMSSYLKKSGLLSVGEALHFFQQLVAGLQVIHAAGFSHGDIKLENLILIQNNLKIADFGLASTDNSVGVKGSKGYSPPETFGKLPAYGHKGDIFSAAVVLFRMIVGHPPFSDAHRHDPFFKLLLRKDFKRFWRVHTLKVKGVTKEVKDLIQRMLDPSPISRPTACQVQEIVTLISR